MTGPPPNEPGKRYGPYEIIRHVATGGTASVYLARRADTSGFDKVVALKLIHPYLALHDEFVEMFLDEARIAAKVSHANVCPVFDFGRHEDTYYLAMDYIIGEPLSVVWETLNELPEARQSKAFYPIIATIMADAAEGLHAAHELRDYNGKPMHVVHRDVTPSNIFVAYNGAVRMGDFGFAKSQTKIHATQPGMIMGTFTYMSPEQVAGQDVDRRADLWGVGVILWELVTGKRLFGGRTLHATFDAIMTTPILEAREIQPDAPEGLDAIVKQCLARDRADRHPTARALSQDLRRFAAEAGSAVGPAEIAAWMQFLFPRGLEAKRAQLVAPTPPAPVKDTASKLLWPIVILSMATAGVLLYSLLMR